ncbi:MAG: holo-ACP synthase, partial [Pseudomonadota bacterium]|nr:holo-ACP synthase [Pseudomonadota bacterium]
MAIAGLGTDIVEIARLGKGDGANERLAKRVLTPAEWQQ